MLGIQAGRVGSTRISAGQAFNLVVTRGRGGGGGVGEEAKKEKWERAAGD